MSENHIPAEIFGYPPSNQSKGARNTRSKYLCPFIGKTCTKQTRLLKYPLGVCSAWHKGEPRIICPERFYFEDLKLLKSVTRDFLGEAIQLTSEVELKNFGNVDWVGFTITKTGNVDFIGIEIMADSTTQTGQLVKALKDFMEKKELRRRYNYGMNTYNTIKLSFTQMLNKGQVFEKWNKYYVWILQNELLAALLDKFKLEVRKGVNKDNKIVFASISMKFEEEKNIFVLELENYYSTSVDELLHAYRRGDVPDIETFVKAILRKAGISDIKTKKLTEF